jgi:hypothetical protein
MSLHSIGPTLSFLKSFGTDASFACGVDVAVSFTLRELMVFEASNGNGVSGVRHEDIKKERKEERGEDHLTFFSFLWHLFLLAFLWGS